MSQGRRYLRWPPEGPGGTHVALAGSQSVGDTVRERKRQGTVIVRLSSRGPLVIPAPVREALGLQAGTRFHVRWAQGRIILEPLSASGVEALYGKYAGAGLLAGLEAEHRREIGDRDALCD